MAQSYGRIRTRIFPIDKGGVQTLGKKFPWNTNIKGWHPTPNQTFTANFNMPFQGGEVTADELHSGPPYREGGPMRNLKAERITPYGVQGVGTYLRQVDASPSAWEKYVGGFAPPGESSFGGEIDMSNANNLLKSNSLLFPELSAYGSQAWSKTKPRLEQASAFVFVAELRDLPRMMRQLKERALEFHKQWINAKARYKPLKGDFDNNDLTMPPGRAASYFLEHQFGWTPFLSDLRKFYSAFHGSETTIQRLSSQNGKPIRRKATLVGLPVEVAGQDGKPRISYVPTESDVRVNGGNAQMCEPGLHANFFSVSPSWELRRIERLKVSATGMFTYYRPEFDTSLSEYNSSWFALQRQLTLYGMRISPSNIYRATPWTWLVDWFTNVAEHFDWLTDVAVDSIAAKYLYLNCRKEIIWRFTQVLPFRDPGTVELVWERKLWTNERVGANSPYGFSLSWENLTPRQLAILVALGITRGKKPAGGA
jgi:hypothetical protein